MIFGKSIPTRNYWIWSKKDIPSFSGSVEGLTLSVKSVGISRMSFAKEPHVTEIVRTYKLNEEGKLEFTMSMATTKTPLTKHLQVTYEKLSFLRYN